MTHRGCLTALLVCSAVHADLQGVVGMISAPAHFKLKNKYHLHICICEVFKLLSSWQFMLATPSRTDVTCMVAVLEDCCCGMA